MKEWFETDTEKSLFDLYLHNEDSLGMHRLYVHLIRTILRKIENHTKRTENDHLAVVNILKTIYKYIESDI